MQRSTWKSGPHSQHGVGASGVLRNLGWLQLGTPRTAVAALQPLRASLVYPKLTCQCRDQLHSTVLCTMCDGRSTSAIAAEDLTYDWTLRQGVRVLRFYSSFPSIAAHLISCTPAHVHGCLCVYVSIYLYLYIYIYTDEFRYMCV